tara:strand:+ start:6931 stop:8115 length:1185 start_codon:yes stop_codon:yes gene_type:complete
MTLSLKPGSPEIDGTQNPQTAQGTYPSSVAVSLNIIAVIAVCVALYLGQSFFLPIALSIITALTLGPVVSAARRLFHIPSPVSAALLLIICGAGITIGAMTLATPLKEFLSDAPQIGAQLKEKLKSIRSPVDSINSMGEEVEKITSSGGDGKTNEVVVKGPGLIARAADDIMAITATTLLILVLSFFLLVSRDMFFKKAIRIFPKLSDKKKILALIMDVEHDVSRYLLTVAVINACMGMAVGVLFYLLDVPTPHLWAVLAALLNFLPYIGALIGVLLAFGVSIISFDTLAIAMVPSAVYLVLTIVEGQFLTPMILGRRFSLNTVAILVSIAFWGFMWGPVGVLIAVPLLIIFKVLCERVGGLNHIGEFLSGENAPLDPEPQASPASPDEKPASL